MRGRGVSSVVRALSSVLGGASSPFFFFFLSRSHPFCLSSPAPAPLLCTLERIPALVWPGPLTSPPSLLSFASHVWR